MHDIVVIGGSAGALEGVFTLLESLPDRIDASLFLVLHAPESGLALVPRLLQRHTRLPVRVVASRQPIRRGVLYLAAPDHHLLVQKKGVTANRGPKQNRFRPAIDPLFTSAAVAHGPRVVGVLLSGWLDDGVHGLAQVQRAGGIAIVQDPREAPVPTLPLNALEAVRADAIVPVTRMAALLEELSRSQARPARRKGRAARTAGNEVRLLRAGPTRIPKRAPSPFTCPECDGALWETHDEPPDYTCHVGHRFTATSLLAGQRGVSDTHMWSAVRSLEEQAEMHRRWAAPGRRVRRPDRSRFRRHAEALEQRALILRRILIERQAPGRPPARRPRAAPPHHR